MSFLTTIAGAITGSSSKAAGSIVTSLADGVSQFINTPGDKEKALEFIKNNQLSVQQEIDAHTDTVMKAANEAHLAELNDVQSARDMEIKIQEATSSGWLSKNIVPILAVFVSLIWGSVTVYLLLRIMNLIALDPNINMTALMGFYAALCSIETIIISFYFGSSSSSQKKDDTIATIAKS